MRKARVLLDVTIICTAALGFSPACHLPQMIDDHNFFPKGKFKVADMGVVPEDALLGEGPTWLEITEPTHPEPWQVGVPPTRTFTVVILKTAHGFDLEFILATWQKRNVAIKFEVRNDSG